ncbi:MAG: penicillin-binding protein activator [Rhodospirillaceae bacterium]|nr:penicillin-binding protein activator [Rhodospirillaceae bacterium]
MGACAQRVTSPRPQVQGPVVTATQTQTPEVTSAAGPEVRDGTARIGLLLPLTGGPPGDPGNAMLHAAEIALLDLGVDNVELLPRDTHGTEDGAREAANAVIADGANIILGPFFGRSVPGVADVARSRGLSVIAFTTDASVAGSNVLVMGFLPGNEVDRIIQYGKAQGLESYAVLAPQDRYGEVVAQAAEEVARARGVRLGAVQFYSTEIGDYSELVRSVVENGGYDAVLLPDAGLRLRAVASLIPYYGGDSMHMLGTGIWAGQAIGAEQALQGAWYAAPQPELRAAFEDRYEQLNGSRPPLVAALAYDAVSLAARLMQQPGFRAYDHQTLTDSSGFAGISGIFRFDARTGLVQRGLAVMEVTENGTVVREAAPESFVAAGL